MSKCEISVARSINKNERSILDALAVNNEEFLDITERLKLHTDKKDVELISKMFDEVVLGNISMQEFTAAVNAAVKAGRSPGSKLARHITDNVKDGTINISFGKSPNESARNYHVQRAGLVNGVLTMSILDGVKEYTVRFYDYRNTYQGWIGNKEVYLSDDGSMLKAIDSYGKKRVAVGDISKIVEELAEVGKEAVELTTDVKWVKNPTDKLGSIPSEARLQKLADFTKDEEFSTTKEGLSKTLDKLYALGKNKVPENVLNHYQKLISSTRESFFRDVNLYLKNTSNSPQGWFNTGTGNIMLKVGNKAKGIYQTSAEVYMHELVHAFTYWGLRSTAPEAVKIRRSLRFAQLQAHKSTKVEDLLTVPKDVATKEDWDRANALYKYVFSGKNSLDEFVAYTTTNPQMMKHLDTVMMRSVKPKTVFEHVTNAFTTLVDVLMGRYDWNNKDTSVHQHVVQLAVRLGEINGKASDEIVKSNPVAVVSGLIESGLDFLDEKTAQAMHKVGRAVENSTDKLKYPENGGPLQVGMWGLKFMVKAVTNKVYRDTTLLWLSSMGLKPESDIRQFGSDLFAEDEGKSMATWLTMKNNKIDALRNGTAYAAMKEIKNGFNRPLSDLQEEALTAVLIDTDLGHMVYTKEGRKGIDNSRMVDLLSSEEKLAYAKKLVQNKIASYLGKETARANLVKDMAMLLGIYKATGKVTPATLFNAKAIAMGHGTSKRYAEDKELVAMIRELSTLWALENVSKEHKEKVTELLKTEREGVYNIIDLYNGFKFEAKHTLFENDEIHMIDGYSKEIFEPTIAMQVRKMSERADLEAMGFEYKGPVKLRASGQTEPLGYFVSKMYGKAERLKGATNLGSLSARGTSIKEINYSEHPGSIGASYAQRDIAVLNSKASEMITQMAKGELDLSKVEWGVARVVDNTGTVVDYRVMMNKDMKKELLEQNTKVSEVLAWSIASVQNKVLNKIQNDAVLEAVKEGMKEWESGTLGGDTGLVEYDLIGPNSHDPEMVELYYMLPKEFRDFINARADKTMAVRRDLRLIMFGYQHAQISGIAGLKELGPKWKGIINSWESLWFDLVSIVKGTILLKMPWVITTNIISNFLQVITMGVGIGEAIGLHSESIKDVKTYISHSREKLALELELKKLNSKYYRVENKEAVQANIRKLQEEIVELNKQKDLVMTSTGKERVAKEIENANNRLEELRGTTDTNGDVVKRKIAWVEARIELLEAGMKDSPVKELVDAGLMQALVEDVDTASMNDNNRITKWIDDNMQKAPELVRQGGDILYLTQNTPWYKVMQEMLQLSDLVARDVLNRKLRIVEEQRYTGKRDYQPEMVDKMKEYGVTLVNGVALKGKELEMYKIVSEAGRLNTLKTRFINYTQPNGRYEEWLNKAGLLMFTKYFKRIQREIIAIGSDHPVRAAIGVALAMTGLDTVQGQSLVLKGEGLDGTFGLSNLMPIHSPIDVALTAVVPPLVRLGTAAVN